MDLATRSRVRILGASLALAAPFWVQAGDTRAQAEVTALMSGNAISGIYNDKPYKQNNHADGIAVVHIKGDKILTLRPDGSELTAQWNTGFIDPNHE